MTTADADDNVEKVDQSWSLAELQNGEAILEDFSNLFGN